MIECVYQAIRQAARQAALVFSPGIDPYSEKQVQNA
jgi:hypothetical protein